MAIKKILWMTWKDRSHPLAGGAEVVNEELAKRLVKNGYQVQFIVGGFPGGADTEVRDGFTIHRVGGRWSVYWKAYRLYKKRFRGWADLVVDEVNTIPFFAAWYVKEPNLLFIHQLCREIWFYQIFFPFNLIGYLLEPLYLRLLNDRVVITVSESSKKDLLRHGFKPSKIHIISEGIEIKPLGDAREAEKYPAPTVLGLGSVRKMKRTDQIVKAFELAKAQNPELELILAGDANDRYGKALLKKIELSAYKGSIHYLGKVDEEKKRELMRRCHLILVTSVKEGWGLVVSEANSQGTPAIVYNVDGLRDSVKDNQTGVICLTNKPSSMAENVGMILGDDMLYKKLQQNGLHFSKKLTFDRSFKDFIKFVSIYE